MAANCEAAIIKKLKLQEFEPDFQKHKNMFEIEFHLNISPDN